MRTLMLTAVFWIAVHGGATAQYPGNYTANPYISPPPGALANPYGTMSNSPPLYGDRGGLPGSRNAYPYDPNGLANPYGAYGSPYGLGNPYGLYGSPYGTGNPYGLYGSPYGLRSPNNPYGMATGVPR